MRPPLTFTGEHLLIQEYRAPKSVPEHTAKKRFTDVVAVAQQVMAAPEDRTHTRIRSRQRGKQQYQKQNDAQNFFTVTENEIKFCVNLTDYLDTGFFLDHRVTRQLIRERAKGKHFLNLFSYTATVSVCAAAGGAKTTTSVDMSKTYSDWAQENFSLNDLRSAWNKVVCADVTQWLPEAPRKYDLIFVDPPTFSNSKKMAGVFDIQQDHLELLQQCGDFLNPKGEIIFSTNARKFKLDVEGLSGFEIEDWNKRTLPEDFQRRPKIHQCWRLQNKEDC